ncbi:pyridoxamine 5'-phosphate oxidase family protein [Nesterenkonia sp. DZ6]|uniref:pyridoxamine 5'-phosphate oxidase family protein n=1 Tax=Nesterenkonia sp. DZ6 TaxID=2901229 RepID=UPI001F4CD40F|nr:pyridoxamine 5'-phosphate oxidase family protein [Nesterenkonia sp. DZ6]MCH8559662.1 pyridoxamine 5'-phosphate oxidase family protein [Nesterenkonia sp. DZ6]
MTDMTANELVKKLNSIGTCMFTTVDQNGRIVSRPMGVTEIDDQHKFWFFTPLNSDKIEDIIGEGEVNLSFVGDHTWVSIAGSAQVIADLERKKELWDLGPKAYFEGGPEDPNAVLIEVTPETAQYWEGPGKAAALVKMAKASLSSETPNMGDQGQVEL